MHAHTYTVDRIGGVATSQHQKKQIQRLHGTTRERSNHKQLEEKDDATSPYRSHDVIIHFTPYCFISTNHSDNFKIY